MSGEHSEIFLKSEGEANRSLTFSIGEMALRDQDGNIVPLRRQAAALLAVLAEEPGKVVAKQDLIDSVWGKAAVTEDSLTQCISDVRRAIGDNDRTILQTHPRVGYSLRVGAAVTGTAGRGSRGRPLTAVIALVAILLLGSGIWIWRGQTPDARLPSIAVLAFDDLSAAPDTGYLSDAISDGIISALARFSPFTTIARNSSFAFRDRPRDIREIGQKLNAEFILEGSQQKQGDLLQVTAQLIDAKTGTHIWADTYQGTLDDIFVFQAEIVRGVASTVGGILAAFSPAAGDRNTLKAWTLHAEGLRQLRSASPDGNENARSYFKAAIEADPNFSFGYLGMGFYYRNSAWNVANAAARDLARSNAMDMAKKAAAIAPDNYLVHYLMGHLHADAGDLADARAKYDKTKELNPSFSNAFVSAAALRVFTGDAEGAASDIRHAMAIDPLHPTWFYGRLATALWAAGECEAAQAALRDVTVMTPRTRQAHAAVSVCLGEIETAKASMKIYLEQRPGQTLEVERGNYLELWTAPGQLDRWLEDMRIAGMP